MFYMLPTQWVKSGRAFNKNNKAFVILSLVQMALFRAGIFYILPLMVGRKSWAYKKGNCTLYYVIKCVSPVIYPNTIIRFSCHCSGCAAFFGIGDTFATNLGIKLP